MALAFTLIAYQPATANDNSFCRAVRGLFEASDDEILALQSGGLGIARIGIPMLYVRARSGFPGFSKCALTVEQRHIDKDAFIKQNGYPPPNHEKYVVRYEYVCAAQAADDEAVRQFAIRYRETIRECLKPNAGSEFFEADWGIARIRFWERPVYQNGVRDEGMDATWSMSGNPLQIWSLTHAVIV